MCCACIMGCVVAVVEGIYPQAWQQQNEEEEEEEEEKKMADCGKWQISALVATMWFAIELCLMAQLWNVAEGNMCMFSCM